MFDALRPYDAAPTFYVPALVLDRNPQIVRWAQSAGAEIGIHGLAHNDYRMLSKDAQLTQISQAMNIFQREDITYQGFRNPYLGWNEDSLAVFRELGLTYDSNEAIIHKIIDPAELSPILRDSFERSLELFQAIPATEYNLRPHTEEGLLRIPTSIPDDEMIFDRLLMSVDRVGEVWSAVMRQVYELGGIYVLNLHPERGVLARSALDVLLACASKLALKVWITRPCDVLEWWRERARASLTIAAAGKGRWRIALTGAPRATIIVRNAKVSYTRATNWPGGDQLITNQKFQLEAPVFPGVALSPATPASVEEVLREQGYPVIRAETSEARHYAYYVDRPGGLGATRRERQQATSALVHDIEHGKTPLVRIGLWPSGKRAALSITGDVDSVTVQDFFLRIREVRRYTPPTQESAITN
jgi:peptidoglycan/xylan/chitin deacetylase (PgdA/CDA1 family)